MSHFLPAMGKHGPLALYDPFTMLLGVRKLHERLIDQARVRVHDRVLDVGCGTGNLTLLVARRYLDATVVGLDPDPAALTRARKKAGRAAPGVSFDQGYAEKLPYPDASFDVVLSALALHHVDEDNRIPALREIARVLRPGGSVHLLEMGTGDTVRPGDRMLGHSPHARSRGRLDVPALVEQAGLTDPTDLGRERKLFGTFAFYMAVAGPAPMVG